MIQSETDGCEEPSKDQTQKRLSNDLIPSTRGSSLAKIDPDGGCYKKEENDLILRLSNTYLPVGFSMWRRYSSNQCPRFLGLGWFLGMLGISDPTVKCLPSSHWDLLWGWNPQLGSSWCPPKAPWGVADYGQKLLSSLGVKGCKPLLTKPCQNILSI